MALAQRSRLRCALLGILDFDLDLKFCCCGAACCSCNLDGRPSLAGGIAEELVVIGTSGGMRADKPSEAPGGGGTDRTPSVAKSKGCACGASLSVTPMSTSNVRNCCIDGTRMRGGGNRVHFPLLGSERLTSTARATMTRWSSARLSESFQAP